VPLDNRDYVRGEHPPTCTCVTCERKRLGQQRREPRRGDFFRSTFKPSEGATSSEKPHSQRKSTWSTFIRTGRSRKGMLRVAAVILGAALVFAVVSAFLGISPFSAVKDRVFGLFKGSDVSAHIMAEGVVDKGASWDIPVEVVPSDSVQLNKPYTIELLSSDGYSFGKASVSWTQADSRTVKQVLFRIPSNDKVATQIGKLEVDAYARISSGKSADLRDWYESNLEKLLKVKVTQ